MNLSIDKVLTRGVAEVLPSKEGLKKLMEEKKITLYQGFDPTGPQLHIGHAVALKKLSQFQDLGHHVIFLIGDFTALIGDPSGKSSSRKPLTEKEVKNNALDYKKQASKILNFEGGNPAEIRYNSEWLSKLSASDFFKLSQNLTYQQIIERDMFQKRQEEGKDIYLNEFLYPFMQGYDSIYMNVDLEVGGTDQTFNMLIGRKLMRNVLKKEKYVLTVPLLTDSSGNKIGKTEGNVIGLADPPREFFGKIMSLADSSITKCFELLTDVTLIEINEIDKKIKAGENPMTFKKQLAYELTKQFNAESEAKEAQEMFEKTFQEKTPSYDIKVDAGSNLANTIALFTSLKSISDAKRLIDQRSVDVNDVTITDPTYKVKSGDKIKVGDKTFIQIK